MSKSWVINGFDNGLTSWHMKTWTTYNYTLKTGVQWTPFYAFFCYYWVILYPKSKGDKVKVTNLKNLPKFQIFEFLKQFCMRHTFLSCFMIFANMKWIRWVLLKLPSGHHFIYRRTDGRTDGQGETSIPPFQLLWSEGYNKVEPSRRWKPQTIFQNSLSNLSIKNVPLKCCTCVNMQ